MSEAPDEFENEVMAIADQAIPITSWLAAMSEEDRLRAFDRLKAFDSEGYAALMAFIKITNDVVHNHLMPMYGLEGFKEEFFD